MMLCCVISSSASRVDDVRNELKECNFIKEFVHIEAVHGENIDTTKLSPYGKYLMFGCRGRHTHHHFDAPSALGAMISHIKAHEMCVEYNMPTIVMEDNALVTDIEEFNECCRIFMEMCMIFLTCHRNTTDMNEIFKTPCPNRLLVDRAPTLRRTQKASISAIREPITSAKCYMTKPEFSQHMLSITQNRYENLHVDVMMTLEASDIYGPYETGMCGVYDGKLCRRLASKTARINHKPVINNDIITRTYSGMHNMLKQVFKRYDEEIFKREGVVLRK